MTVEQPQLKAVYSDKEAGFFEDDLRWQAQWYSGTTHYPDGYERGGWYATEEQALAGAHRGLDTHNLFKHLFGAF